MKIRFLADADLNKAIVNGVVRREPSVDFQSACAAGLRGMKDDQVLALAAAQPLQLGALFRQSSLDSNSLTRGLTTA